MALSKDWYILFSDIHTAPQFDTVSLKKGPFSLHPNFVLPAYMFARQRFGHTLILEVAIIDLHHQSQPSELLDALLQNQVLRRILRLRFSRSMLQPQKRHRQKLIFQAAAAFYLLPHKHESVHAMKCHFDKSTLFCMPHMKRNDSNRQLDRNIPIYPVSL